MPRTIAIGVLQIGRDRAFRLYPPRGSEFSVTNISMIDLLQFAYKVDATLRLMMRQGVQACNGRSGETASQPGADVFGSSGRGGRLASGWSNERSRCRAL